MYMKLTLHLVLRFSCYLNFTSPDPTVHAPDKRNQHPLRLRRPQSTFLNSNLILNSYLENPLQFLCSYAVTPGFTSSVTQRRMAASCSCAYGQRYRKLLGKYVISMSTPIKKALQSCVKDGLI
ncbi:hypothetical protein A0H81_12035 [Grifola frondosa]|uniref:Uncharacterized protein n=1 Tax=Grifola frondosa TaxID=5627 RepID=A0A1C7LVF6_GRIFR|nr:hypothetical protein A0H81_12035 [Grifola frondosa]